MDTSLHAVTPRGAPNSRTEEVYVALRSDLLLGRLGYCRLLEEALAKRFATSRTPVREALRMLERDGHVERHISRGLVPSPPRVEKMRELYEVRMAIEEMIARRACTSVSQKALDGLKRQWDRMRVPKDLPSFVHADESFHVGLAEAAEQSVAGALLRDINDRIRVLRMHDFTTVERVEVTIYEHRQILGALLDRDAEVAVRMLRENIERSAAVVEQRVGEALARMFAVEFGA